MSDSEHTIHSVSDGGQIPVPARPCPPAADAEAVPHFFREHAPPFLDGTLSSVDGRSHMLRAARQSLSPGRASAGELPAEALRETLAAIAAVPAVSAVKAGFTAIGPNHARVWWDDTVLDNLDDVLARLEHPRAVLRFFDVTGLGPDAGRWNETFDIDILLENHGHTAQFARADREYVVELGYVHADGRFLRLARTNAVQLPRSGRGGRDAGDTARSLLRGRDGRSAARLAPDAAALAWVAARPDAPDRDVQAEVALHLLYRAFLREGPRALRRAPCPARRDASVLTQEFFRRERDRANAAQLGQSAAVVAATAKPMLVVSLASAARPGEAARCRFLPAPAAVAAPVGVHRFGWFCDALAAMRSGAYWRLTAQQTRERQEPVTPVEADREHAWAEVVLDVPVGRDLTASVFSAPAFMAAQELSGTLAGVRRRHDDGMLLNDSAEASRLLESASLSRHGRRLAADAVPEYVEEDQRVFGGNEAKRMAKAGVRITRMSLTLEGRMRPGARLKVAGKLVHADAEGKFRLECVLSGKKASIPMRAGVSVGGEARSLINVEWARRAARDKTVGSV